MAEAHTDQKLFDLQAIQIYYFLSIYFCHYLYSVEGGRNGATTRFQQKPIPCLSLVSGCFSHAGIGRMRRLSV
jgi:hypothetical protein